jgi:mono/diheme cytochrome c family protein
MRLSSLALWLSSVAGLTVFLSGCKALPPSKSESQWTRQEARGAQVFQQKCSKCHYPTTTHSRKGPGLQAITKAPRLPSGASPTDERLIQTIRKGRLEMPAAQLSDDQMKDLLAYLHTL